MGGSLQCVLFALIHAAGDGGGKAVVVVCVEVVCVEVGAVVVTTEVPADVDTAGVSAVVWVEV